MKARSPGFQGERLRAAREARGMTAKDLAAAVGVTPAAVSQYEGGHWSPAPDTIERLAKELRVKPQFFFRPRASQFVGQESPIFFRSLASATKRARTSSQRRFEWLQDIVATLSVQVRFPQPDLPAIDARPEELRAADLEEAATSVRRHWGLGDGPISDVLLLLENKGILVARADLGSEALDAFSAWVAGVPYVVLNTTKLSAARARFDAAHELGHLLLHRSVGSLVDLRTLEQQAFAFAGAFLLPARTFSADFFAPSLNSLEILKPRWKVSIGVMIKRARTLDLIDEDQERRLWISYSKRGYRSREPLDDKLPVEQPRLLRRAVSMLAERNMMTSSDLADSVGIDDEDFCELTNASPTPALAAPPVLVRKSTVSDTRGTVIPFPKLGH
jgi:Zn-dependent peptidase ImmA (M78 family)/transcriptional regulator with XRE-family HTH domain